MNEVKLLIGGQERAAGDGATFDRINPVTGEVATRAAAATLAMPLAPRPPRPSRPGRRRGRTSDASFC